MSCRSIDFAALYSSMGGNDTAPATKADIQAVLSKLDTMATKEELTNLRTETQNGFAVVNRRLDVLNNDMLAIVNNLANNVNRADERLEDHEIRIE